MDAKVIPFPKPAEPDPADLDGTVATIVRLMNDGNLLPAGWKFELDPDDKTALRAKDKDGHWVAVKIDGDGDVKVIFPAKDNPARPTDAAATSDEKKEILEQLCISQYFIGLVRTEFADLAGLPFQDKFRVLQDKVSARAESANTQGPGIP